MVGPSILFQLPVCLALIGAGFNFEDLKSTVMFLYAFHYIMKAFKAFFRFYFHQDCDEDVWLPIVIVNGVTQVILQSWGCSAVSRFIWQNINSGEKTPTVIFAIIIVGIEWALVVIMLVNIYNSQLGARMSTCFWGERPQSEESTNSRTPVDNEFDNDEPNEDMVRLLTLNTQNNTGTEDDIDY